VALSEEQRVSSNLIARPADVGHLEGLGAGLGGRIRSRPEDFLVEEIPIRPPTGRGDFTRVHIEKRATPTFDMLLFLSKAVKVSERRIGYGGLKDARAVARQYVSIPKVAPERLLGLRHPKFRVLSAERDAKPLKIGHLKGNRFTIRVREPNLDRTDAARETLERLVARGMPNGYGIQRYGVRQDGHLLGRAMVREDWGGFMDMFLGNPAPSEMNPSVRQARRCYDAGDLEQAYALFPLKHRWEKRVLKVLMRGGAPRDAFELIGAGPRRIWLSAWQSYLFNCVLHRRVQDGTLDKLEAGDVGWLHDSGAQFDADEHDAGLGESGAASPTGPLLGYDPRFPSGRPGALEREVLAAEGAEAEAFRASHCRARGGRRPLRVRLKEATLGVESDGSVLVRFVLPPGAFATIAMEHLMVAAPGPGGPVRDKVLPYVPKPGEADGAGR